MHKYEDADDNVIKTNASHTVVSLDLWKERWVSGSPHLSSFKMVDMKVIWKHKTANVLNYKPIDTPIDITHHCSFTTTIDEETMKITLQVVSCTMAVPALQRILELLFASSKLNRTPPAPSFFWESIDVAAQLLNKHS